MTSKNNAGACNFTPVKNCNFIPVLTKYALLESRLIYDPESKYHNIMDHISKNEKPKDIIKLFNTSVSAMQYYINEYKVNRWILREAPLQLNKNLNSSISYAIKCLFYLNGSYAPADDRALYFSFNLENKPKNFEQLLLELNIIKENTIDEYKKRESLFRENFIQYIEENKSLLTQVL